MLDQLPSLRTLDEIATHLAVSTNTIKTHIRAVNDPNGTKVGPGEFAKALSILKMGGKINYDGASGSCDFDQDGAAKAANLLWEVHGTERVTTVEQIDL